MKTDEIPTSSPPPKIPTKKHWTSRQITYKFVCYFRTERGAVRLAHLHGVQGVPGSNPGVPTIFKPEIYKAESRNTKFRP